MDTKIKELLSLEKNPFFKLLPKEQKMLDEWKAQQKRITPKKRVVPKGYVADEEMGTAKGPTLIKKSEIGEKVATTKPKKTTRKKTTNQVKTEDKELGEIKES